jgi:2-dehydro-3-deoxygalactonokinase
MSTMTPTDDCILGDWGTTRLRLCLLRDGQIEQRSTAPGVASFSTIARDGAHATTSPLVQSLLDLTADWRQLTSIQAVSLAGMAGSRNGIVEVPYARVPIRRDAWARAAWSAWVSDIELTIAAGLKYVTDTGGEVMRGEETQVFGAMQLQPQLSDGSHVLILPGTHSKWVELRDGAITRFSTAMTGEIFALLRTQSTLLSIGANDGSAVVFNEDAFDRGVTRAMSVGSGLLVELFQTRTAQLLGQRSGDWAQSYLSGLLIGSEIATLSTLYSTSAGVYIVGEPQLATLYERTLAQRNVRATMMEGDACVIAGLRTLHTLHRGESA